MGKAYGYKSVAAPSHAITLMITIYKAVRLQLTHFSFDYCENTCTSSSYLRIIIKPEIWTISQSLELGY